MNTELSFLEMLNDYPVSGAMMIAMLLVTQKLISTWKGGSDVSRIQKENLKLARQTSETVNRCSERTGEVMAATKDVIIAIEKHLEENNLRHISSRLDDSIQVLEEMAHHKDVHHAALERVADLCRDIVTDIRRTDSRVVHANLSNKIDSVEKTLEDVKRIVITK